MNYLSSTMWKLFSGVLADKIEHHMGEHMSDSQKGVGMGTRGAKHQLVIDKMVAGDSRRRSTNLAMAWIDYKKAYDYVPNSWILESLELYKIHPSIKEFIATSMNHWKTTLLANNQDIDTVNI